MAQQPLKRPMFNFTVIWFGQLISMLGSGMTSFALGVWVYQQTGSVTQFALIALFATLPGIVLSPIAGVLADRWDRRWMMIISDSGSGLSTLALVVLLLSGKLELWHIYLVTTISSSFNSFQWPAYAASVALLVPKQHLGRANGMDQVMRAVGQLLAPALAGALLLSIGLYGVILFDVLSFSFAVITLLLSRIPRPTEPAAPQTRSVQQDLRAGWSYLVARPGLLTLLLLFGVSNIMIGIVSVLVTPLVLAIASARTLGLVLSLGGSGMLFGSILMSVWGGPRRRIYGMYCCMMLEGLAIAIGGLRPSIPLFTSAAFCFFFALPIDISCCQAIIQSKVPPTMQGRVFAVQGMISRSSLPLAYLLAGPLAEHIFEPLMAVNGRLAPSVGRVIGTGPGRGIALLFIVLGLLYVMLTAVCFLYPRLRLVEHELPDALVAAPEQSRSEQQRMGPSQNVAS